MIKMNLKTTYKNWTVFVNNDGYLELYRKKKRIVTNVKNILELSKFMARRENRLPEGTQLSIPANTDIQLKLL